MKRSQLKKLRRRKKLNKALNKISNNFPQEEKMGRIRQFDDRRHQKAGAK